MKILFYTECWIEKSLPNYRVANTSISHKKIIDRLTSLNNEMEIKVIAGDYLKYSSEFFEGDYVNDRVEYVTISLDEVRSIIPNYKQAANKLYNQNLSEEEINQFRDLYLSKLVGFVPDVIISYESLTYHLQKIFPKTLILNELFGLFSRYPFPKTYVFDHCGLYKDSYPVKFKDELNAIPNDQDKTSFINDIKAKYFDKILASHDPTYDIIKSEKSKFEKIVLLPLQGSNYFAFEENYSNAANLFDYICDVMDKMDPGVGVLVTEHTARERVVNDSNLKYLRNKYPNFLYFEDLNEVKFHSQFLLRHVDGCVFVTSSVGFLAALLQKPVFQIGKYESFVSSGNDISKIGEFLSKNDKVDKDGAFHHLFNHYYFHERIILDPKLFYKFLETSIAKFRSNNIGFDFYDVHGDSKDVLHDILHMSREMEMEVKNTQYTSKFITKDPLLQRIRNGSEEIVSFDIFDTLILRPFHRPRMLFQYIEDEVKEILKDDDIPFFKIRVKIEKSLRKKTLRKFGYLKEVTLDEIYQSIQNKYNIEDHIIEKVKQVEIDAELRLCYKRDELYEAYQDALFFGKKVIIVSDTYLPKTVIEDLLKVNGYDNYHELFVSSEYGVRKEDGRLFKQILDEEGWNPKTILHIGDNAVADIENSAKLKIHNYHTPKPIDLFLKSQRIERSCPDLEVNFYDSVFYGIVANKLYSNPANTPIQDKTLFNGSAYNLGLFGLGGMLFCFAIWLSKKAIKGNYKKLYFLSREGKILKDVYDIIRPYIPGSPESEYLLTSRRSVKAANMFTFEDIISLVFYKKAPTTIKHLFEVKLGVSSEILSKDVLTELGFKNKYQIIDYIQDYVAIKDLLRIYEKEILSSAEIERDNYLGYLSDKGLEKCDNFDESHPEFACIDIGYNGSMQLGISNLLNRKIDGFYLATQKNAKRVINKGMICDGFLFNLRDNQIKDSEGSHHDLNKFIVIMEVLLSDKSGSLNKISKNLEGYEPEFFYSSTQDKMNDLLTEVHSGILDFGTAITNLFGDKICDFNNDTFFLQSVILSYFKDPTVRDIKILQGIALENAVGHMDSQYIVPDNKIHLNFNKFDQGMINILQKKCIWKNGTDLLIQSETVRQSKSKKKRKVADSRRSKKINTVSISNKHSKIDRKINKLINDPDLFWKDLKFRPLLLLKPFLSSDRARRRISKLVYQTTRFIS